MLFGDSSDQKEEEEMSLCCGCVVSSVSEGSVIPCRRTKLVHCAMPIGLSCSGCCALLSSASALQGARHWLVKCSRYPEQGTLQPLVKCSLG